MAQIQPTGSGEEGRSRSKRVRYGVPLAVAGLAAATIGLVPALADTGDPDLPEMSAEDLVAKMAASDVDQLSGTVKVENDLGLPGLMAGGGGGGHRGGPFGGGHEQDGREHGAGDEGSGAAPQRKLMELASGEHTLRVAADGPDTSRVSVVEEAAEYSFIRNGNEVWAYDSGSDSVFHGVGPERAGKDEGHHGHGMSGGMEKLTPKEAADKALQAAGETTSVSVDGTTQVAGRDAYQLLIQPKDAARSTIDSVRIAVDAENGAPLSFRLSPVGGGKPAVDIAYTEVDFAKPDADTFTFTPPRGADVTERTFEGHRGEHDRKQRHEGRAAFRGLEILGDGWGSVAEIELPGGGLGGMGMGDKGAGGMGDPRAQRLLDSFTDSVKGDFGTGRVVESRLVNALITEDGTVYAGAVTKEGLIEAAERAARR